MIVVYIPDIKITYGEFMSVQLSDHFTYSKLLRFTIPSIIMMVFTSIYNVVDGLFVSNFVGASAFAAVNLIIPFFMILGAVGFMFSSGGSALVAKTLGEKRKVKANRIFALLVYACAIIGFVMAAVSLLFVRKALEHFGVEGNLLDLAMVYCNILMPFAPLYILQCLFQAFLITAEKPKLSMIVTIAAGVANIGLDALFIMILNWGVAGAAWATVISMTIGAVVPLVYFLVPNASSLRLGKTGFYGSALIKSCTNGLSEFMSNISMSVVAMLYNYQLLRIAGENGVVAYGIIAYANFIFTSVFFGFAVGSNPIVSYHYGAQNVRELKNLFRKNFMFIGVSAVVMTLSAEVLAGILARIFVGYDAALQNMTAVGFRIYAISFLFAGFNIYASAFFTALNNGIVSAVISCVRTLVCECGAVLVLPVFFGLTGIWSSIIVAETAALAVSVYCLARFRHRYKYV